MHRMNDLSIYKKIRVAICDDEKIIALYIKKIVFEILKNLDKNPEIDVFLSGKRFLESSVEYNLVFMDIELKNENGLDILNTYRNSNAISVILTSHAEKMSFGYHVHAFRFLLKPIEIPLLKEAIYSALDYMRQAQVFSAINEYGSIVLIKMKDIIYFEAGDKKCGLKSLDNFYMVSSSLKEISPLLDTQFYSVHRSYIINMNYVDKIEKDRVHMLDGSIIKISRLKKNEFTEKFYDFIRRKSGIAHFI